MSIAYSVAQNYLKNDALHVASSNIILSLPATAEQDQLFFDKFRDYFAEKYYTSSEGSSSFSRVKYFPIFSKLNEITRKTIQLLQASNSISSDAARTHIHTLYQCVAYEHELLQSCDDPNGLEITPIFLQAIDYLDEFEHVNLVYSVASAHFKKIKIEAEKLGEYNHLFFGTIPFVRLFGSFEFDPEKMFNELANNPQKFQGLLREKFLLMTSESGRTIYQYLTNRNDHQITPRAVLQNCGYAVDQIEPQEYYRNISEVIIAHYILSNKLEDLILLTTQVHSFYGLFCALFYKKTDILLRECHLSKASLHVQPDALINLISKNLKEVSLSSDNRTQFVKTKTAFILLGSLYEWLSSNSNSDLLPQFLSKLIVPANKDQECQLYQFFMLFDKALQKENWHFQDFSEFYAFSVTSNSEKYYFQGILDTLVEILTLVKHQMTTKYTDIGALYESSILVSEFLYLQRKLDLHFKNKLTGFDFGSGYFSVHFLDKYLSWINVHAHYEENVVGYLTFLFTRLEELCNLSVENQAFVQLVHNSKDPEILLKKHYLCLRAFKSAILQILEENNLIIGSTVLYPFITKLEASTVIANLKGHSTGDIPRLVNQKVHENCVSIFVSVLGLLKVQFYNPSGVTTTIITEELIEQMGQVIMNYVQDKKGFLETCYIIFEAIRVAGLKDRCLDLIPDVIQKYFTQVLPDLECYNPEHVDTLWKVPVWESTFLLFDPHLYPEEPHEREVCQNLALRFYEGMNKNIKELGKEFVRHDFTNENVLRNELVMLKIKSSMHQIGGILKKSLPLIHSIVNDLLARKEHSKLELLYKEAENIFLNPIFHINEFYRLDFLRTIKGAYSANTAFVSGTIDRVYETFIRITKQLSEVVLKNKDNARFMETLGGLMGNSQNLLLNLEKKEIESCEILGPQVISCLLTLEGLYHFLGSLYEGYEAGLGKGVLGVFVENFRTMLNLGHLVDSFNNGQFLGLKPEGGQAGERTLERNIYTTLFTESICTEYIMEQAEVSGSLLKDLEAFLTENLTTQARNLSEWGRQITAFDMVNSFLLDNESASTAKIMGYNGILKTVLDWIVQVFKNYSQLPPSNLDVLTALDAKISEFIAKTWTVIQVLYEEKAPADEEDPLHTTLLEGIAQKEEVFYLFICEALKTDLSYYETLHLESLALQSLFHAMYEFVQRIKQYGGGAMEEEGAPNTSTNLNDKGFFETIKKNMNYGLVGAIKSPYLFSLILSNQDCLDILNLAETTVDISQTLHDLVEIAHQYVQQGEKETPRNSLTKRNNQCHVDLNLEFLSEKQRGLRVLEFLCHVLSLVSKMPFDFDPTTLGLSEVSYGLELDFLCESNMEIFQQGDQKSLIEALKFCYNSLYTNTLRTAIKKNVYKVTLDPLKDLTKKNLELNERALKAILHQFSLEKSIKEVLNFRLFKKDAFEPYLFMVSLWWVNAKDCLKNLPDEPGVFQRMIENAKSEQNMELMVYFLTLYMLNAFPEKEIIQIIVKGLVYLDRSGQMLLEDSRVDIYQAISSQNLVQTMQENFSIDGVWLSLIGEEEKTNSYGVVNGVSSYEYLIKNINSVSKKVLNILLETLLKAFDNYVREISHGRKSKVDKVLRPLWILTILLGRFPELVPYVASYRFDINGYEFKELSKEVIGRSIEGEVNFFEFLIRVFMWYFPGCNPIQEVFCNPQKPIVIRLGEKDLLLEEMMVQMYLEEMLNFMNEDLRLNEEKIFEDSPFGLWRWEVCLMKAYDIVVTSRTAIPEELLQRYIIFLFKSLGICKTKTSFSAGKLIKSIGKLLEGITMSMVVNQFNKGLKKVDKKDLKLNLQEIASTKEGLRLALYVARKARDSEGVEALEDVSKIQIEEEEEGNKVKTNVATVPSAEGAQGGQVKKEQEEDRRVLVKEFKESTEKILKGNNIIEFNTILFGGSTLRKCHWSKEDNVGGALAKSRVEGFYGNLSKAQGVVLNLCREHIVHKKIAKNKFALFFELQDSSDSTEIFNKSCLEMLYSGWGSDYASEKTWQKLESDALDIAVGNVQVGQTDNQNLLDGGFKEALRRELLAGFLEVQEAEKPVVGAQETVGPAIPAAEKTSGDLISQAAILLTKEGSLLKKNLYLWLEDITMKQVEGGLINQKEQKYRVEDYLRRLGKTERIATCYFLTGAMVDGLPEDHKEEVILAKRGLVQILGNCLPEEVRVQNGDLEDDEYEEDLSDISDDEERSKGSKGERNDDYASDEEEGSKKRSATKIPPVPVIITKEPTQIEVEPAPTPVRETDEMEEESLLGLGLKKTAPVGQKNGEADLDKAEKESVDDQEAREINGLVYTREEEEEVKDLYDKVLGKAGVGEIISEGIIRISEEAILELIKFFLEETREESAMKDKEYIGNVRTYYREIDTLMINPYNQDALLHILTFLINCPQDCLIIPNLDHYNFKYFLTNVLGFLTYYVQINPKSLFKYIPQDVIQRHSSLLNRLVKIQELPTRISQLQDSPFFNRIFALASLQESQTYKPLFESVITLLLSVSKISKTLNDPLPINITDLKYLKPLILSCENFASTKLLAKISKLLRILIQKSDCVATVLEIEKGLVQESVPELLVYLKEKHRVLALATSKSQELNGLIPLEDSQGVARELLEGVVKVDKLKEVLRCLDYNLEIGGVKEEVLSFYSSLGGLDDFKELLKIMGQILIGFKKVENITLFSVIDIYVHGFIYGFTVLKGAVNATLLREYEKVMEEIKEFICQVFKTNIGNVIKDSRLVEKIKTSPLSKVLDFDFKKSLLERHFQEAQIANKAFYIPLPLRRSHILEDAIRFIDVHKAEILKANSLLRVNFAGERMTMAANREFVGLVLKDLLEGEKGLFTLSTNKRSFTPNFLSFLVPNSYHLYYITGLVIALSVKEGIYTGFSLSSAFAKLLLGKEGYQEEEDLREIDQQTYEHITDLRAKKIQDNTLTFTYKVSILGEEKVIELVEGGKDKPVTEENKEEYIGLLVKRKLQGEIEGQVEAFRRGLLEVLPEFVVGSLQVWELEMLLCGPVAIDLEELSKNVEYKGCSVYDEYVQWLWEILEQWSNENRRRFLYLVSGSSTIGARNLNAAKIQIVKGGSENEAFRVKRWLNEIELSEKVTKEKLREGLEARINQEN